MAFALRHRAAGALASSSSGSSSSGAAHLLRTAASCSSRRVAIVRRGYQVDVDGQPKAPDAAPGRWGAAPPPPPPPPPPPQQPTTGGAPSRREALFGLLGAGLGVGVTTAYYKGQYPDDDASLAEALDSLLDNPDFLDAVADELLYQEYEAETDENNAAISRMRNALLSEAAEAQQAERK